MTVNTKMSWASLISVFLCQAVIQLLLLLAGDVEQNPGPPKILKQGGPSSYKYKHKAHYYCTTSIGSRLLMGLF